MTSASDALNKRTVAPPAECHAHAGQLELSGDAGDASPGAPRLVHDLVDRAAAQAPADLALTDRERSVTFAEFADESQRWAAWLKQAGVAHGDRVALSRENSIDLAALIIAACRVGATAVPLSPRLPAAVRRRILTDAAPRVTLDANTLPDTASLVGLNDRDGSGWPPVRAVPEVVPADPALILYTSGTTASPKGVVAAHRNVVFVTDAIASRLRYRPDDVVYCCLPFSFDYGLYQLFLACDARARLVIDPPPGPNAVWLLKRIGEVGATVVPLLPHLATGLAQLAGRSGRLQRRVRLFTSTGAAFPQPARARLRRAFPGAQLAVMYGLTECKRVSICEPDADLHRPDTVGRPLPGTQVQIVDDTGQPLPPGRTGEVVVRGDHVMRGYWRSPELTTDRFRYVQDTGQTVLHTGDYGHLDRDGYLYLVGRRDDLYKQRGLRVSTTEVEAATLNVTGVRQAAAIPLPTRDGAVLYVDADTAPETVLRELAEHLEPGKIPSRCIRLDAMPQTTNGKVDRAALRAMIRR